MTTKKNFANELNGVGRRKSAVARVWLTKGESKLIVNERDYREYFTTDATRTRVEKPISIAPVLQNYTVHANVVGGGATGQADAIKLGIARALLTVDENLRIVLREHGLLTVDSRLKERKKYGQKGARRKFQFVKR